MKPKSMVLLAVAVACGLVAMLGVQQLVSNGTAAAEEEVLVRVLVAAIDVSARTPLDETNTEFRDLPEATIPDGAVTDLAQIADLAPKSALYTGDIISLSKLTEDKRPTTEIPKGMRVVTVSVNLTKTHSGLITPGDFVDLQVTYQARNPEFGLMTKSKTFLQNIEVFATDAVRSSEAEDVEEIKAKNISLLVSPRDANLLKLAESLGDLHLVLRGKDDFEETDVEDFDMRMLDELTGIAKHQADKKGPGEPANDDTDDESGDVRSFLSNVGREPAPRPTPAPVDPQPVVIVEPVVEEPKHEVWNLEIRAGEEIINEQILVPIEKAGSEGTTDDGSDIASGLVGNAASGVVSTLKRVLNGGAAHAAEPGPDGSEFTVPTPETSLPEDFGVDEETAREAVEKVRERLGDFGDDFGDFEDGTIPQKLLTP